jgi:hypothetical protein
VCGRSKRRWREGTIVIEFDAINTSDINEFKKWLNDHSREGWQLIAVQVQNAPGLPVKPFTALVNRETMQMAMYPPLNGERGS